MRFLTIISTSLMLTLVAVGCGTISVSQDNAESNSDSKPTVSTNPAPEFSAVKFTQKYPHNTDSYTQGLLVHEGKLYESTGEYGRSQLRVSDIETGEIEREISLPSQYFGEGLAMVDGKLYQLTWMEEKCFIYDPKSLKQLGTLSYSGEGWGLTTYGDKLLMSDGTSELKLLDPKNLRVERIIEVSDNRGKVEMLNELEIIGSKIYANIYMSPLIAVINPDSGAVERYIDCSELHKNIGNRETADVFNGIAYDSVSSKVYLTGKLWDSLFEVEMP